VILNWIDHQFLFPIWYSRHTWNQWRKRKKEKKHTGCGIDIEEWRSCLFLLFLIVKIKDEMTEKGRAFLYVLKCGYTCASHRAVGEWYGWFYYMALYICFKFRAGHCDKDGLLSYWTGCKGKVLFIALFHLGGGAHQLHYCQALSIQSLSQDLCVWWMAIPSAASQGLAPLACINHHRLWFVPFFGPFFETAELKQQPVEGI
jgi:hypothetical protein